MSMNHRNDMRVDGREYEHPPHHSSFLNPSPDAHNHLKNSSMRYPESTGNINARDNVMVMNMPPPMLSVGGNQSSLDSGVGNYHINRPNQFQMPNLGGPSPYKPHILK